MDHRYQDPLCECGDPTCAGCEDSIEEQYQEENQMSMYENSLKAT